MKIVKSLRKERTHGGVIPAGWRLAWYEPKRRVGVYYPAPLNWILRVLRELRHRAQLAVRAPGLEREDVFPDAAGTQGAGAPGGGIRARVHVRLARMFSDLHGGSGRRDFARGSSVGYHRVVSGSREGTGPGKLNSKT